MKSTTAIAMVLAICMAWLQVAITGISLSPSIVVEEKNGQEQEQVEDRQEEEDHEELEDEHEAGEIDWNMFFCQFCQFHLYSDCRAENVPEGIFVWDGIQAENICEECIVNVHDFLINNNQEPEPPNMLPPELLLEDEEEEEEEVYGEYDWFGPGERLNNRNYFFN